MVYGGQSSRGNISFAELFHLGKNLSTACLCIGIFSMIMGMTSLAIWGCQRHSKIGLGSIYAVPLWSFAEILAAELLLYVVFNEESRFIKIYLGYCFVRFGAVFRYALIYLLEERLNLGLISSDKPADRLVSEIICITLFLCYFVYFPLVIRRYGKSLTKPESETQPAVGVESPNIVIHYPRDHVLPPAYETLPPPAYEFCVTIGCGAQPTPNEVSPPSEQQISSISSSATS